MLDDQAMRHFFPRPANVPDIVGDEPVAAFRRGGHALQILKHTAMLPGRIG